jgi:AGCS family alanine or glycine:cation symporter
MVVLVRNAGEVPGMLSLIVTSAFQPAAPLGGFAGASFIFMLTWGIKRGLFSNESGQGSAPIAHAAAKTDEPIREGVVAMLGPFIDTLLICTMTGLVILTTGVWKERQEQRVILNEQASVTAIVGSATIDRDGVVDDEHLVTGSVRVRGGSPSGFSLVRNHGIVEDARLMVADDPVLLTGVRSFDGMVIFDPDSPGEMAQVELLSADGERVNGSLVLEGRALQNGSPLTAWAFQEGLGAIAGGKGYLLVTVAVFFFGLSTAISWSYYGDRAVLYLFGPRWTRPYRVVFCIMHFLGAVYSLELVWAFGDMALGLMTVPNLISILLLTGVVKGWVRRYVDDGKLEPPVWEG